MYNKIKNYLYNGGLSDNDYSKIYEINSANIYKVFKVACIVLSVFFTFLFAGSFFINAVNGMRYLYLGEMIFFICAYLILKLCCNKRYTLMRVFLYLSAIALYSFGIGASLVDKDDLSVSLMVIFIIVPTLIIDRPFRIILMHMFSLVASIILVISFKDESTLGIDVYNLIMFSIIGVIINIYMVKHRFNAYLNEYKISRMIRYDALTGLENEYAYLELTEKINKKINNKTVYTFGIVMLDVNCVKVTNDAYGHTYGCAMIVEAGHKIKEFFKASRVFHVGGDEFIVFLQGNDIKNIDNILKDFDEFFLNYHFKKDDLNLRLSLARGVSFFDETNDSSFSNVLKRADMEMYKDKKEFKEKHNLESR